MREGHRSRSSRPSRPSRPSSAALAFLAFLALLALPACSSSEASPADAAPVDGGAAAPLACAAGDTAEGDACVPAGLVTCPAGLSGAAGACRPTFPATCKPGSAKLLGESACVPLGHVSCPTGAAAHASGWGCAVTFAASCTGATRAAPGGACVAIGTCPSTLPAGTTRYVDDEYGAGMLDATHFATLTDALAGAPAGTVVSVAAGTYHENVTVPAGLAIVGACTGDVILEPAPGATTALVTASAGAVTLRGLTLRGAPVGLAVKGATVSADAMVVEQSSGVGIRVDSGALALKASVIRGTTSGDAGDGIGLFTLGGSITLDDVTVDGSAGTGLAVWRTSKVVAHGLSIVRTTKSEGGALGWGVDAEAGASFEGTRVFVAGASFAGVAVSGKGTRVRLDDSVVTDVALGTFGPGGPNLGAGIALSEGASAELHRVTIAKTAGASMLVAVQSTLSAADVTARDGGAAGEGIGGLYTVASSATLLSSVVVGAANNGLQAVAGAKVSVDSVLVRDTRTTASTSSGIGALASQRSTLSGRRLTLERNATAQLAALDEASVQLESLATVDPRSGATDNFRGTGIGLIADRASKVTLDGAYVGQSQFLGVSLRRGASLEAKGLVIDGVELVERNGGYGMLAIEGTSVALTDFAIRGAHGASLVIGEKDTKATLVRGTLRDVKTDATPGVARGVSVQAGATASLERVRIQESTATAMYVTASSQASLVACVVDGVVADASGRFGDAFEVVDHAVLRLDRSVIRHASGAALVFAGATGAVDASLVEHNAVGIHVQGGSALAEADAVPGDLADGAVVVTRSTTFLENETKVGQGELPLPQPLPLE